MNDPASGRGGSWLDRSLRIFADVRAGEGGLALLMLVNVFVVLVSYYVLKTTREPLILTLDDGPRLKSYASAAQAGTLILVLPLFAWLTSTVPTRKLLYGVTGFFLLCVQGFYVAWAAGWTIGFVFYVWVGIFSLSSIALFWGFANEVYRPEDGERLFPLIGVGMTGGAFAGSALAGELFDDQTPPGTVLQVAAGILLLHGLLYALTLRRPLALAARADDERPGLRAALDGFGLVFTRPYLRAIAALILLLNLVNATGEYVLSEYAVSRTADALAAARAAGETIGDVDAWEKAYVGAFYGRFYLGVNILAVFLQAFVASRLVKAFGVAGVLFALPLVAGVGYALAALGVGFVVFRWAKSAENATDYSIMNTARAMLWLPTSRDEKYKAKQTIDTFVVRSGDVLSAGAVYAGTTYIELGPRGFAAINVVVVAVWLLLARMLYRAYRAKTEA